MLFTIYRKKSKCSVLVRSKVAFVSELRYNFTESDDDDYYGQPFFSYTFNGQEYVGRTGNFVPVVPHSEGETVFIRINPNDPGEIYDEEAYEHSIKAGIVFIITGLIFAAIGFIH